MLKYAPCVYVVGKDYRIVFLTEETGMAAVEINGKRFWDAETGLVKWNSTIHHVTIPQEVLDRAGKYTVCFMAMTDRKPYFAEHGEEQRTEFDFKPMDTTNGVKLYHIADTHGNYEDPVACAKKYPDHTLVFDGDIASHNSSWEDLYLLFKINEAVTGGNAPILFARGNHDSRGPAACLLPELIPIVDGNTYYTFAAGNLFGIMLDCGEDKPDNHAEYGDTVAFEPYRQKETEWLEKLYESGEWKNYKYRIAVCHVPFTMSHPAPFNIAEDLYKRWTELLGKMGINMLISGHMHVYDVIKPGDELDAWGQQFVTVVGSSLSKEKGLTGCAIEITDDGATVSMTDPQGDVRLQEKI